MAVLLLKKTPSGYPVKVYDEERCICDLIKDKKSVDLQFFSQALNVEAKVRMYMEVL